MITTQEIDVSIAVPIEVNVQLIVGPKGPAPSPVLIGKWKRKKFQYLSHRRKRQYMKDWKEGKIQQAEFVKIFGTPNCSYGWLADPGA